MDNDNKEKNYLGIVLDGRYELLEPMGSGGMAVVYRALDNRLNRQVAIKIMRPEIAKNEKFRNRFQTESHAIAKLNHPNIVNVYDVSHSDNIEYIVMELLDGVDLKKYLADNGPLDARTTIDFTLQIADALKHAHGKGIVHRDIKPHNIIVLNDDTVKVADFGIAALQSEVPHIENEAIGSVHYISPEQAKGNPVDNRSDLYSLGIVMYEMLSGQVPFDGEDDRSIALKHLSAVPTPLKELVSSIPDGLEAIVMKAMDPSLEERYQNADALIADLEKQRRIMAGAVDPVDGNVDPVSSNGEMNRESYLRRRRRSRIVSTLSGFLGVMIFILFLAGFLWSYWLKDIFAPGKRITIPNFVGSNYETIVNSKSFKGSFNFNLMYEIDPDVEKGIIIRQSPEAGKSYMLSDRGINVDLTISTGVLLTEIPDYIGHDYKEATSELEKLGFTVEKLYVSSDDIELDSVVEISPTPGEKLPAGATVYVYISTGPQVETVIMPYLVGYSQKEAEAVINSYKLILVSVSTVYNDNAPVGTVVSQNVEAGTEIAVNSKIYLQISLGPEFTPTPLPTAEPELIPEGAP